MMNSYSTEDAGRSGMGLHPPQHYSTTFSFFSCNASSKVLPIHREGAHGWVLCCWQAGPTGNSPANSPLLCTPMPSDSLSSTFTKARRLMQTEGRKEGKMNEEDQIQVRHWTGFRRCDFSSKLCSDVLFPTTLVTVPQFPYSYTEQGEEADYIWRRLWERCRSANIICIIQKSSIHFKSFFLLFFTIWIKMRCFMLLLQQWGWEGTAVSLCMQLSFCLSLAVGVFTTGIVFKKCP